MLRRIVFCVVSVLILSCKGDNDDIILANDTTNIDFETGIVFGVINPLATNESVAYNFTNAGIFQATNASSITSPMEWEFTACPFSEDSFTYSVAKDVENIARGIREIPSTDIAEADLIGLEYYVLEYETEGERKTIQFYEGDVYNDEMINTYLDYIKETLFLVTSGAAELPPATCDDIITTASN